MIAMQIKKGLIFILKGAILSSVFTTTVGGNYNDFDHNDLQSGPQRMESTYQGLTAN